MALQSFTFCIQSNSLFSINLELMESLKMILLCRCCQGEWDSEVIRAQEENSKRPLWIGEMDWKNRLKEKSRTTVVRNRPWTQSERQPPLSGTTTLDPEIVSTIKRMWFDNVIKRQTGCRVWKTRTRRFSTGTGSAREARPDARTQLYKKFEGFESTAS